MEGSRPPFRSPEDVEGLQKDRVLVDSRQGEDPKRYETQENRYEGR